MEKNVSHFAPPPQALTGYRGIPALLALHNPVSALMQAVCRNLLHSQKPWRWISATGGSMLLGSARVLKGAEQQKAGAHLERQLPSVDAMFGIAKRLVLEDG
jgi:hypothetical protein